MKWHLIFRWWNRKKLDDIFWVFTPSNKVCFDILEEFTTSVFTLTGGGLSGCWSRWEEGVCQLYRRVWMKFWPIKSYVTNTLLPVTSASSCTRFVYLECEGSIPFWNLGTDLYCKAYNPKKAAIIWITAIMESRKPIGRNAGLISGWIWYIWFCIICSI